MTYAGQRVVASAGDDRQRFEEIYRATHSLVVSYCRRRLPSDDVPDAVSQIYTVAWQKRSEMLQASLPIAWLHHVGFNTISSTYRSKKWLRQRDEKVAHHHRAVERGADAMITVEDDLARVLRAIRSLSPGDQEVIRLAACEELSYAAIGAKLGISAGAARSKLYRARRHLRAAFEQQPEGTS